MSVVQHALAGKITAGEFFSNECVAPASVMRIPVADVIVATSPRASGEDAEHIQALAAAQHELPPIIVQRQTMRVIDGVHRLRAATLKGQRTIPAVFFDGPEEDAFVIAVKANTAHGLPLSFADRKAAAERIVTSHPDWSNRMIANVTGIASGTVAELRSRAQSPSRGGEFRIGRDGRARPLNSSERRRVASELIASRPELPLREVAKEAGISPETARNVRNSLLRGEDPVPRRQRGHQNRHPRTSTAGPVATQVNTHDQAAILDRLSADPALRLSETGRSLLRLLRVQLVVNAGWQNIADNAPAHCSEAIADLAREAAHAWQNIADRVERQAADASPATTPARRTGESTVSDPAVPNSGPHVRAGV